MMIRPTLYTLFLLFILTSCDRQPAAIDYGTTSCHSCKMTIVDQQHAAQVMTKKGRTYSFDAIECMVRSLDQWQPEELQTMLVTDYTTPKQLIEAQSAHYLISKAIPSPMGAHLSAFSKKENRDDLASNPTDQKLAWSELKFSIN
ncbi:MAG: nitrous oxide reductase accessory protein NosL [Reichenbachiella sp.]|uniref:nitrous oxide reductase accessory protein NosL n=1 Tax=Reichenbachiella sp. TaxID=2184521 RepID=UPI003297DAD5